MLQKRQILKKEEEQILKFEGGGRGKVKECEREAQIEFASSRENFALLSHPPAAPVFSPKRLLLLLLPPSSFSREA